MFRWLRSSICVRWVEPYLQAWSTDSEDLWPWKGGPIKDPSLGEFHGCGGLELRGFPYKIFPTRRCVIKIWLICIFLCLSLCLQPAIPIDFLVSSVFSVKPANTWYLDPRLPPYQNLKLSVANKARAIFFHALKQTIKPLICNFFTPLLLITFNAPRQDDTRSPKLLHALCSFLLSSLKLLLSPSFTAEVLIGHKKGIAGPNNAAGVF